MQLRRYIQSGALFADALNSLTDLANLGYTKTGSPTVVDSPFGKAIHFGTNTKFATGTLTFGNAKTLLMRIKRDDANDATFWANGAEGLPVSSNVLIVAPFTGGIAYVDGVAATAVGFGSWQSIGVTATSAFSLASMEFGLTGGTGTHTMRDLMAFDRILFADEMLSIHNGTLFQYERSLVSRWDLSNITTIPDLGWRNLGNDGAGVSLTSASIVDGHRGMGKSIEFDGANDYVSFTQAQTDSFRNNGSDYGFSVSLRFKKSASNSAGGLFDCRDSTEDGWGVACSATHVVVYRNAGSISYALADTQWHHVVATWSSADGLALILDGVLVNSGVVGVTALSTTVGARIADLADGSDKFPGRIDEVRIYNSILLELQSRDLWEATR